jgi:hypothetical protein
VLSNHYHVVLRVDHDKVSGFTDDQVIRRWKRLFSSSTRGQFFTL